MTPAYTIDELVPHSGTMLLLDELIVFDSDSLSAGVSISEQSLFLQERGVPAWVGIEYMAQAVAAYGGVQALSRGEPVSIGLLLGSRKYSCNQPFFPLGCQLTVTIRQELQAENGLGAFSCTILSSDGDLAIEASANLNVFLPDDVDEFLNSQREPS